MNAFLRLRQYRLSISTRPFQARGGSIIRCEFCGLPQQHCACDLKEEGSTHAAFCLLMYDTEPMKPSNTGRLIADTFPKDTYAFLWSRTQPNPELLQLLENPEFSPVVVFPDSYVSDDDPRGVLTNTAALPKRPLYILLDGTWTEARKMFRKSPYLDRFPVISVQPETLSEYRLRVAAHDQHLCTVEVACCLLRQQNDLQAAGLLERWFCIFRERYLKMKPHHQRTDTNIEEE